MDMNNAIKEQTESLAKLKEQFPEMMGGFFKFMDETEKENALDVKTKELITLSLAVKAQCHWCIAIHVKKCLALGATKPQIMESAMLAVMMGGGPALMYVQLVQEALEQN